jgi:hypothetical protein
VTLTVYVVCAEVHKVVVVQPRLKQQLSHDILRLRIILRLTKANIYTAFMIKPTYSGRSGFKASSPSSLQLKVPKLNLSQTKINH